MMKESDGVRERLAKNKNKIISIKNKIQILSDYKKRLNIAMKAANICIFEMDLKQQKYTFFENSEDIFGIPGEKILDDIQGYSRLAFPEYRKAVCHYFCYPEDKEVMYQAFDNVLQGRPATYEARMKAGESEFIWCKVSVTPVIENGAPVKMIGIITNIDEIKKKTQRLEEAIKLDEFTGLYNKKSSKLLIEEELRKGGQVKHALVLLDLDDFKNINDTYGHIVGDMVLKEVAAHLKRIFRKTDIVGRFGGDEYIILIKNVEHIDFLFNKLEEVLKSDDNSYNVTKSIGVAIFPSTAKEFLTLLDQADEALYKSKEIKDTYTIYGEW